MEWHVDRRMESTVVPSIAYKIQVITAGGSYWDPIFTKYGHAGWYFGVKDSIAWSYEGK